MLVLKEWCGVVQPSVAVQERQAEPVINLSGAMSTTGALSTSSVLASTDEDEMTPEARQCVQALREGKRCAPPLYACNRQEVTCASHSQSCLSRRSCVPVSVLSASIQCICGLSHGLQCRFKARERCTEV